MSATVTTVTIMIILIIIIIQIHDESKNGDKNERICKKKPEIGYRDTYYCINNTLANSGAGFHEILIISIANEIVFYHLLVQLLFLFFFHFSLFSFVFRLCHV